MTKLRNVALMLLIGFSGIGFTDCDEATSPPISAGDLRIQHRLTVLSLGSRLISPYSVNTSGIWLQDSGDFNLPFASGDTFEFGPTYTGTDGRVTIHNGREPAIWRIYVWSSYCHDQYALFFLLHEQEKKVDCVQVGGILLPPGSASPSTIDAAAPPSTVTISGEGLTDVGGIPTVEYYDPNGNLAQQTQATECAADGSWISGPTPDLSECATGAYTLIVRNAEGEAVGSAVVTVFNFLPPCNSDPEAVSNCEAINYFWNYDNCTCVDHIN